MALLTPGAGPGASPRAAAVAEEAHTALSRAWADGQGQAVLITGDAAGPALTARRLCGPLGINCFFISINM